MPFEPEHHKASWHVRPHHALNQMDCDLSIELGGDLQGRLCLCLFIAPNQVFVGPLINLVPPIDMSEQNESKIRHERIPAVTPGKKHAAPHFARAKVEAWKIKLLPGSALGSDF